MAAGTTIARLLKSNHLLTNKFHMFQIVPQATVTAWNKDWKPGPYPKTEEERRAAAKKYNLIPEDYEPHQEEEGFGDYPKLQPVSAEARNPFEVYDFTLQKRNYGEPLHVHFDVYQEDLINVEKKYQTPLYKQNIYFLLGFCIYVGLVLLGEKYPIDSHVVPKQYPKPGVVHYTFEPADE